MKADRFIKVVLTVIAINLTFLSINGLNIFPKAYASEPNSSYPEKINYALVPVNEDGSIDVSIKSREPMEVNVVQMGVWPIHEAILKVAIVND